MFATSGLFIRLRSNAIARKFFVLLLSLAFHFLVCENGWANSAVTINKPIPFDAFGVTLTPSNYSGFNISCNGKNDGSINTSMTGGISPFTFLWSNSATTQNLNGLSGGTYTVTITDNTGDVETASITLIEPAAINIVVNSTDVTCYGGSNGASDITVSGGATPYTYFWSNGATSEDISGLIPGTYVITVNDINFCSFSTGFDISEPDSFLISGSITNVNCNAAATGAINITASGGTGPLTYLWSNSSTNQDLLSVIASVYTLTVTDSVNCSQQNTFSVTEPVAITPISTLSNVNCHGDSNGFINLDASGGTGTLNFLWSNGSTTKNQINLTAGTYTVTITDSLNCNIQEVFTVTQPDSIIISSLVTNVSCFGGSNGAINISVTGGTGSYSYLWSNSFTSEDIINLNANNFIVTVTDSLNCNNQETFTVTEPTVLAVSGVVTDVPCNGTLQGAIDITATGGAGNYTYLWSNASTAEDQINLAANTYTVIVTDLNNCTAQETYVVSEPSGVSVSAIIDSVNCYGESNGSINLIASGGAGVLSYLWSNNSTSEDQINLTADLYSVTITDSNSCSVQQSYNVFQPDSLSISAIITDVLCNGQANGSINITAIGGTSPINYLWNDGSTNEDRINLIADTYSLTVSDFNNCTSQVNFIVSQPDSIQISGIVSDLDCNGGLDGAINITSTGGTGTLTYLWNNNSTSEDQINLTPSTYTVTVTDTNSCSVQQSFVVNQPPALLVSGNLIDVGCNGASTGSIDITTSGGTGTISYLWSNGSTIEDQINLTANTYTVTATDANNCTLQQTYIVNQASVISISGTVDSVSCNGLTDGAINITASGGTGTLTYLWSNGSTIEDQTNLSVNTYTVTVTDSLSCTAQQSFIVSEPTIIVINGTISHVTCNGGSNGAIDITPTGGTGTFVYLWSNSSTAEDQTALTANSYTVTATDVNGCSTQQTFVVTEPTIITLSISITNANCNLPNGSATAIASGGTGVLNYLWNNGTITATNSNLFAGTYTVTVTDQNNCSITLSATIINTGVPVISLDSLTMVNCNGESNGAIDITVTGGIPLYVYLWSNWQ